MSNVSTVTMHALKKIILFSILLGLAVPQFTFAQAAAPYEISGWIPYWRSEKGVESILPQLHLFTEVNPFAYTVKLDGSLNDAAGLNTPLWLNLQNQARAIGVKYVPTVMWSNPDAIDEILSDEIKRQEHIRAITLEVYRNNFDGIDIDYEAKYARTRPYFSLFLKELEEAIGFNKLIMCTIEARTPLDSRYSSPESIPADIEYANDFVEINKYCDRVRIMTYDQGRIDLKLNESRGDPYAPVADVTWVEKAIRLAAAEIDKSKLVIGVATYGYEYDMFDEYGEKGYALLWSFNPGYGTENATRLNISPVRANSGEMMLIFPASSSLEPKPLPNATRVLSWSDAEAIRQKAKLAEELGVRGIAIFKIDGGQDPLLWNVLTEYKSKNVSIPNSPVTPPNPTTPPATTPVPITPPVTPPATTISPVIPPTTTPTPPVVPPVAIIPVPTRNLLSGSVGEDVKNLQKILNAQGFTVAASGPGSTGNETARFGALTRAAVIRFQKANNITPTAGYFGPITRAAMLQL